MHCRKVRVYYSALCACAQLCCDYGLCTAEVCMFITVHCVLVHSCVVTMVCALQESASSS